MCKSYIEKEQKHLLLIKYEQESIVELLVILTCRTYTSVVVGKNIYYINN